MQCPNCRSQLFEGVAFCQQCGTPVSPPPPSLAPTVMAFPPSPNSLGPDANYNPSSLDPTVAASQPPYSGPDANYNPSSLDPTVAASQPSYGSPAPHTNYNPSSVPGSGQGYETAQNPYANVPYGQPQSGNVSPYGQPQPSNVPPYGQPQPSNVPPYAPPPLGNVSSYAPPPPSNVPPYTPLPQSNNISYGAGMPAFSSPPPVKPKSKVGLIVGIVIAVLLIACVGSTFAVISLARTGSQVNTVDSTPAVTPTPTVLSGNTVDPTAASIVTNIQMASDVDTSTAQPKTLATSFQTGATVYVTFQFDFRNTDVTQQNPGYTDAKYYIQNRLYHTTKPLRIDDTVASSGQGNGYFGYPYDSSTTAGAVEVYWCRKADCSDGALAGTATFTVS